MRPSLTESQSEAESRAVRNFARLYDARDLLRGVLGERYDESLEEEREILREAGDKALPLAIAAAREAVDRGRQMESVRILSACLDVLEERR